MTTEPCAREERLLAALRRGPLDAEDAAHVATCTSCALAADAERWMLGAATALAADPVPSAGSLLLRAQLRARREAAERSLQPLQVWRRVAAAAGGAVVLVALGRGDGFVAGLWTAVPSTPEALFAAGLLAIASIPIWMRWRRGGA